MQKSLISIPILIICLWGYSQETQQIPTERYGTFELIYHSGVYWSRTQYLSDQFEDGYQAIEARIGFQTTGKKIWQQYTHYPNYGFGVHYANLISDPEDTIVGNPFSAFMFYSAPRIRFGKFSLNTDLSLGLCYASRIHDPVTNPLNDVIASHINLYLDFNVNLRYMLSDRLDLKAGYGLTHYSNGRIHMPQKGVNNWGWNVGMGYHFVQPGIRKSNDFSEQNPSVRPELIKTDAEEFSPYQTLQIMYAVGAVEHHRLRDLEGIHYFTSSFTTDYVFVYHPRMGVTFGLDGLYDGSLALEVKGIPAEEVTTIQKMYFGSHLGYHFFIDRVTLLMNMGTYFLQHSDERGFWFIRAGGRVRLTDHLQAHVCIKTKNGVRADWIEWGLATSLKIR